MIGTGARLFVVSSPSGGGKSTVVKALLRKDPTLCYSISATTRPKRQGERHGIDYFFWDQEYFQHEVDDGAFIEWFQIHGFFYGTLWSEIERCRANGKKMLLDIDVQGGLELKRHRSDAILIFLLPPSLKILEQRLRQRGTEQEDELKKRLQIARKEIEMADQYDFQIINDKLEKTIEQFYSIVETCSVCLNH